MTNLLVGNEVNAIAEAIIERKATVRIIIMMLRLGLEMNLEIFWIHLEDSITYVTSDILWQSFAIRYELFK